MGKTYAVVHFDQDMKHWAELYKGVDNTATIDGELILTRLTKPGEDDYPGAIVIARFPKGYWLRCELKE